MDFTTKDDFFIYENGAFVADKATFYGAVRHKFKLFSFFSHTVFRENRKKKRYFEEKKMAHTLLELLEAILIKQICI